MGDGTADTLGELVALAAVSGLAMPGGIGLLVGLLIGLGLVLAGGLAAWRRERALRTAVEAARQRATRAERLAVADVDPVFVVGRDGAIRDRNAVADAMLADVGEARGRSLASLVQPDDVPPLAGLLDVPPGASANPATTARIRLRAEGEAGPPWEATAVPVPAADPTPSASTEFVVRLRDLGEREALRSELATQRLHDPVTGLPSRTLFMDRLAHAQALAARRAEVLGVFVVDPGLSIAGQLPEAEQHAAAARSGERIQQALRHGDSVARLDEGRFAVLLEALHDVLDAAAVAERLLDRFQTPLPIGGAQVNLVPMIGIALSGGHERPEELIAQADAALTAVRRGPFAPYAIYDPSMAVASIDPAGLEQDLRRAFAADELRLHLQPVVRLRDNAVLAYEATPVWQHPQRGLLSTAELTAAAETSGLLLQLGLWSLVSACRQLLEWSQRGAGDSPLVCLDLSRRMFLHSGLAGDVARIIHEAGIRPSLLRLAIGQSLALDDVGATVTRLQALKGVGVQVAISDFGTGYAALGFLQRCPVDCLKIAGTYVAGLGTNPDDSAIVKAAYAFARGLDVPVVAEGVATQAQRDELRRLGFDYGQGDLLGPARPADEIEIRPAGAAFGRAGVTNDDVQPAPSIATDGDD
jgi:EAL domain-containing protein (putative c-di-GMP-specific phosphodiesterase class I)/GGDEF domain-containing protein